MKRTIQYAATTDDALDLPLLLSAAALAPLRNRETLLEVVVAVTFLAALR